MNLMHPQRQTSTPRPVYQRRGGFDYITWETIPSPLEFRQERFLATRLRGRRTEILRSQYAVGAGAYTDESRDPAISVRGRCGPCFARPQRWRGLGGPVRGGCSVPTGVPAGTASRDLSIRVGDPGGALLRPATAVAGPRWAGPSGRGGHTPAEDGEPRSLDLSRRSLRGPTAPGHNGGRSSVGFTEEGRPPPRSPRGPSTLPHGHLGAPRGREGAVPPA